MKFLTSALLLLILLTGCNIKLLNRRPAPQVDVAVCDPEKATCLIILSPDADTIRPKPRDGSRSNVVTFVNGVNPSQLDTSSSSEKHAALQTGKTTNEKHLGGTIASLGDVGQQGFWLKTPLVNSETSGRLVWTENGKAVNVTLIPKQGVETSGSQISLAAMRALEIPLTSLPELVVFAK